MTDLFEEVREEPLNARLDLRNEYLKERHGLPENWCWSSFQAIGDGYTHSLYRGGVYSRIIQRGKNKGGKDYRKADPGTERELVFANTEFEAWLPSWEARTGWCSSCKGSGQRWIGWNCDTGNKYVPCKRCDATGNAPALAAATGTAKTPKAVECEAPQSGLSDSEGNAQRNPA